MRSTLEAEFPGPQLPGCPALSAPILTFCVSVETHVCRHVCSSFAHHVARDPPWGWPPLLYKLFLPFRLYLIVCFCVPSAFQDVFRIHHLSYSSSGSCHPSSASSCSSSSLYQRTCILRARASPSAIRCGRHQYQQSWSIHRYADYHRRIDTDCFGCFHSSSPTQPDCHHVPERWYASRS